MTPRHVLFLCTGNSARSIIAEALLNHPGGGRVRAFSAGSHPAGAVNPLAIDALQRRGIPAAEPRSKHWEEFAGTAAPAMDYVITVCDNAAGEVCPIWPGHPARAHWSVADPAAAEGTLEERREAFDRAFAHLDGEIRRLLDELTTN